MWNRIVCRYRSLSKPVKASLWFVVSNVIVQGVSFFTLPIFSRMLTTAEYGVVSTYQSWRSLVSIITTLTIWGGVFNIAMVKHTDSQATVISSFQGLAVSNTLLFFLISIVLLEPLSKLINLSESLICCIYIDILVGIPFALWSSQQRFIYEYKKLIIISLGMAIANPLLGIIAVTYSPHKAEARIISQVIAYSVLGVIFFAINQKNGKTFFHRHYWKYAYQFNVALIPHYLSMQILNQSDRIMINTMCGSSDAGIYGVAYNFGMLLQLLTGAVESSLTPYILNGLKRNSNDTKKHINQIVCILALVTMMVICVIPEIFRWLLPQDYYSSMWAIPPITAGMFFCFIYPMFGIVELYYEKKTYMVYASIIAAIVNVLTNYIFIGCYGYIAAAYTTLGCYILLCLCHYLFMKKIMKTHGEKNKIFDIKTMVIISLSVIVFSLIMVLLYEKFVLRWGIVLLIIFGFLCNINRFKAILKSKV